MTGLGRSTIYRLVAQRKFFALVKFANRAVAWRRTNLERFRQQLWGVVTTVMKSLPQAVAIARKLAMIR